MKLITEAVEFIRVNGHIIIEFVIVAVFFTGVLYLSMFLDKPVLIGQ